MPHDQMLDNVAAYALGALSPAEAAEVVAHLQSCEACRAEYELLRPAVTAVAYSAQAQADSVSPLLKARIMRAVRNDASRRMPSRAGGAYVAAAACLVLAIVTGLLDLSLNERLRRDSATSAQQAATLADVTAPDARRYHFAGGEVLTRGDRLYLAMHDLPAPPRGRVYQAWTLPKGSTRMAPSITFQPAGGSAVLHLPEAATAVEAVAVSVEPAGGSQQPTSKPIALVRI
jgi:anti-sigma-K factor RskA